MSTTTFRRVWMEEYEREIDFFREESETDPFENWDRQMSPDGGAGIWLECALAVLYGCGERSFVDKFLTAAIAVVNRALAESKFTANYAEAGFPRNRGEALRIRAYAVALSSEELLVDDLVQASMDFEEWCRGYKVEDWNSQAEANLLNAVRPALILGDLARAAALLRDRKPFRWHKIEYIVYRALADGANCDLGSKLYDEFSLLFETVRDPHFRPDIFMDTDMVRFELGVIYAKYFEPGGLKSWEQVVDVVSS